ncbi:ATP-dependent (S)-NAD(P)H-hydrate dehydratase [Podosphaera aphanis]|nr:ATP-dependent (S)-NAD(P)H-hydrate dehydratase [Podosphaera aphanis]
MEPVSVEEPVMSHASKELIMKVRKMIPPLLSTFHKGQMGRVAVIGGSEDYTGAPFFSAIASAKAGVDLSHVICEPAAAQIIKTYSPNLMVHPLMRQSNHAHPGDTATQVARSIIKMLPRFHVLVIGPGLGRDQMMLDTCVHVIDAMRESQVPLVLDADGLILVQTRPKLVHGYTECILTPNVVEFARLCESQGINSSQVDKGTSVEKLSKCLGGVTIIQKGADDYISNGSKTLICDLTGGLKRSGGQGDTLTGCVATFLCWRKAYLDKIWDHSGKLGADELLTLAAFGGSALTRESSRLAFLKKGRSLQASDLTEEIYPAYLNLFENSTL